MSEQAAKVCIWCKQDCSAKPRQKDLKGNYLCKECVEPYQRALTERAKKRRPEHAAPTIPLAGDSTVGTGDVLVGMIDQTVDPQGEACPSCSRMLAADAMICTHCGFNKQTGRQMRSHIIREKGPKESKDKASASMSMSPGLLFLLLALVFGGLAAGGMSNDGLLMGFMALDSLFSFAVGITVLVLAFMNGIGTGLLSLCVPFYIIYFAFAINENGYVKVLFGWYLINIALFFMLMPKLEMIAPPA